MAASEETLYKQVRRTAKAASKSVPFDRKWLVEALKTQIKLASTMGIYEVTLTNFKIVAGASSYPLAAVDGSPIGGPCDGFWFPGYVEFARGYFSRLGFSVTEDYTPIPKVVSGEIPEMTLLTISWY